MPMPGKVMEQITVSVITWHLQDRREIRFSQHTYSKCRSCLTNLIFFCNWVTHLEDEEKPVDVVCLDFSRL